MDEALKFNSRLLKDTKRFIDLYRRDSIKEHVNRLINSGLRVTFQGRPLLLYAKIVAETARGQAQQHRELIAAGLPGKYELLYHTSRSNRVEIKNLFEQVTFDEKRFHFIESALNQNSAVLPKEVLTQLAKADKLPESPKKAEKIEQVVTKSDQLPTQPVQTTEAAPVPVKSEEILATPEEINKEVKYTPKEHPKYSSPDDLKKLDQLLTTPSTPQEKPVLDILPETAKKPEEVLKQQTETSVQPAEAQIFPAEPITPISKPVAKAPVPIPKATEKPKTTPEKTSGPVKNPEISEENGIPQWTSPKTGKKYPLKVAGGLKTAVIPMQRPQALAPAPALPKIELPQTRDSLGQRLSALRRFQLPYPVQNFTKNTLSFGSRLIIRNTPTIVSATIGGFVGGALAGPAGIPAGLVGGGLFPKVIKSGVLQKGATASVAKGAGSLALKGALGLSNPIGWAWLALSAPGVKTAVKYAMIAFLAIFALPVLMNLNKSQSLFPPYDTAYSAPLPTGESGGGIPVNQSCKFTRAGVSAPYGSSTLLNWINSAALSKGIPPAILASIARHESPDFTTNADNNHDNIKSNNYCHPGPIFCEQSGRVLHYDPCTAGEISSGAKNAKALGLMQAIDIYNPDVDLCKITTNIDVGAETLKSKIGSGSFSNADQLKQAVCRYFGVDSVSCPYPGGDYGNEVWNDYQSCQATPQPAPPTNYTASCPVPGGTISTPSYFANKSTGHCGDSYKYACNCGTTGRRAKAIDVPTNGKDVLLPSIDGKQAGWNLILKGYPVDAGEGGGVGHTFEAKVEEDWWYLDILHMQQTGLNYGNTYASGTAIGKSAAAHAHMTIGKNNQKKPTSPGLNQNTSDCDPGWLASDFLCQ